MGATLRGCGSCDIDRTLFFVDYKIKMDGSFILLIGEFDSPRPHKATPEAVRGQ